MQLLREGSYVFSVSGTYTSEGYVSWDFCGEQGGINERLHFNMVKSVCRAQYVEEVGDATACYTELGGESVLNKPIKELKATNALRVFRSDLSVLFMVAAALVVAALAVAITVAKRRKSRKFLRLDTTEHV